MNITKMQNSIRSQRSPYTNNAPRMFQRKGASLSGSETDVSTSTENLTNEEKNVLRGVRQEPQGEETMGVDFDVCSNTLIVHRNTPFDCHSSPFYSCSRLQQEKMGQQRRSRSPAGPLRYAPAQVQEITDIPKQYLDQSEVLKHLAKEVHWQAPSGYSAERPPPPAYPKWREPRKTTPTERMSISRSHPDLSHLGMENCKLSQRPKTKGCMTFEADPESSVSQAAKIVEILSTENASLKNELDLYQKKVAILQNFELEIQKVHQSHEEVVQSTEKREKLERAIRSRLEFEVRRLQEANRDLREQLEATNAQLYRRGSSLSNSNHGDDSELRKELSKRDVLVAQLLSQNKELLAEKERHEAELQAQGATLQEQRNHIDILDNALNNAQTNVVKLEEENRKKQAYVDRVAQLQRALANLQLASDRRLQMEKKVRGQLEKEIETIRTEKEPGKLPVGPQKQDTEELKRTLREYEEKIIALEAEVSKWEQRYLEESTMRQIEMDAASVPKDAKIAALERTSQESEKLIAQARSEKLRQMDELYAAQRKSAELEGQIKDLESKLAERNAMIHVLRHHSQEKDVVLQNAVLGRPPRPGHTRAASTMGLTSVTPTSSLSTTGSSTTSLHHHKDEMGISGCSIELSDPKHVTRCDPEELAKDLDLRLSSKDSIMSRMRAEKELHPNHFWRV